jgi:glucose-6-phosphate isomerase
MISKTFPLPAARSGAAIQGHFQRISKIHLRKLFAEDPRRGTHFIIEAAGLYLDYSKNRVTDETIELLVKK